jgi:hypothetical protein
VKGLRVAAARTLEQASRYLETEFLPWWKSSRRTQSCGASEFFPLIVNQARQKRLLSDEHFTVDGTLVEAWWPAEAGGDVGQRLQAWKMMTTPVDSFYRFKALYDKGEAGAPVDKSPQAVHQEPHRGTHFKI